MTYQPIDATIVAVYAGAEYDGHLWDRRLILRGPEGEDIQAFDFYLVDVPLKAGSRHLVVLGATAITGLVAQPQAYPSTADRSCVGVVTGTAWRAERGTYARASEDVFRKDWVIVEFPFGMVLVGAKEFEQPATLGERVRWEYARLDLLALV